MDEAYDEPLRSQRIGIVGGGHLGRSVAAALLVCGLPRESLLISVRGNPQTLQSLEKDGLSDRVVSSERLFAESTLVLLTVRPQDFAQVAIPPTDAQVAACVAGLPLDVLQKATDAVVCRLMVSGPDTIRVGKGVAIVYPAAPTVEAVLRALRLRVFIAQKEDELDVFTAGVCLPAALLVANEMRQHINEPVRLVSEYPLLGELLSWARNVVPDLPDERERAEYIARMITKGGITETIVTSLRDGIPFEDAIRRGIARSGEISAELAGRM